MRKDKKTIPLELEAIIKSFAKENNLDLKNYLSGFGLKEKSIFKRIIGNEGKINNIFVDSQGSPAFFLNTGPYYPYLRLIEQMSRLNMAGMCGYHINKHEFSCIEGKHYTVQKSQNRGETTEEVENSKITLTTPIQLIVKMTPTFLPIPDRERIQLMEKDVMQYSKEEGLEAQLEKMGCFNNIILSEKPKGGTYLEVGIPGDSLEEQNKNPIIGDRVPTIHLHTFDYSAAKLVKKFSPYYNGKWLLRGPKGAIDAFDIPSA